MSDVKLSEYYDKGNYALSADLLKFLLMPFVFFALLGFPTRFGAYISDLSFFAPPAFFILCGFFVLVPNREDRLLRIKKALKRSAIFFAVLLVAFTVYNIVILAYTGNLKSYLPEILRKRTAFYFLALNVWPLPIGNSIWFIQSLFYGYLFFFIAEKLKLSKLYVPLLILLIAFMLVSGELSAVTGFWRLLYKLLGDFCIPSGAVTRALPYMLIGMLLRKNIDKITKLPRYVFAIAFFAGLAVAYAEIALLAHFGMLVYYRHLIGLGVSAFSVCCFALEKPVIKDAFFGYHGKSYSRRMYALCQPVCHLILFVSSITASSKIMGFILEYKSIIAFFVCLVLAFIIGIVKYAIAMEKNEA